MQHQNSKSSEGSNFLPETCDEAINAHCGQVGIVSYPNADLQYTKDPRETASNQIYFAWINISEGDTGTQVHGM